MATGLRRRVGKAMRAAARVLDSGGYSLLDPNGDDWDEPHPVGRTCADLCCGICNQGDD